MTLPDFTIEDRIRNYARLRSPFTTLSVARWFKMRVTEVDGILCEMVRDRMLRRTWKGDDLWTREERFEI